MKYGRKPRTFRPDIPHWSALKMGAAPIDVPTVCSYTGGLPADLGVMLNDRLGCCAEAGYCHADQVWSVAAGKPILTAPDSAVEALYGTQGYVPGNPSTDQGTVLQSLLTYLVQTAAPVGGLPKLAAFVEIDPTNEDDLNRATYESGLIYLGFTVPSYAQQALDTLGPVLDVAPGGDQTVIGGHCVLSAGYRPGFREFISYGNAAYSMTTAYWRANVDEVYALVSEEFCRANGLTPLGLSIPEWDSQMVAIRGVA